MTEQQPNSPDFQERISNIRYPHLAPIEHVMFGSTPTAKDGQILDIRDLIRKAEDGDNEARRQLFTPSLFEIVGINGDTMDYVKAEREKQRREAKLRGGVVIDPYVQVKLAMEREEIFIELGELNTDLGQINDNWKVFILNGDTVIDDPSKIKELMLEASPEEEFNASRIFTITVNDGENFATITTKFAS